ncbi:MAG: PEP-CTERM sorting domain-containing protein [Phycisphaerales bacterium]|nr:PEP-CTERM sorting domain-containing protein [Phycisphaerales bacterium]
MRGRALIGCGTLALLFVTSEAMAQFTPAVGPGTGVGRIEHAVIGTNAGGPAAVFDGFFDPATGSGGALKQPGFNFPATTGATAMDNDTGAVALVADVPIFLNSAANIPLGFGGATTTMVGLGSGRAGLAATNFSLYDAGPDGSASTNTWGGSVDYVNNSGIAQVGRFGHFISAHGTAPLGGYLAVGVKSLIEADTGGGTGAGFTPDFFWEPLPIIMAFDGVGVGNASDFIQADYFRYLVAGQNVTFSGISVSPVLNIPNGWSIRIHGTTSLVADPQATMDFDPMPQDLLAEAPGFSWGNGSSSDALQLLPEPGTFSLLTLAAFAVLGRRKRQ